MKNQKRESKIEFQFCLSPAVRN